MSDLAAAHAASRERAARGAGAAAPSALESVPPPHARLHVRDYARTTLLPRHRPVVRAFAEALFHHDPPVPEARLDGFAEEVDRFISPASKTLRFGLLLMLDVVRWLPPLVLGRWALFEDLTLDQRVRMLDALDRSRVTPLALILVAYKTLMTVLFFEEPTERSATGYPGPERVRWRGTASLAVVRSEPRP